MKVLLVNLNVELAREVEKAVEAGAFANTDEVARASLREFISHHQFELLEQQQLQDVA